MEKIVKKKVLFVFIFCFLSGSSSFACSSFSFTPNNNVLFGYNFDWNYGGAFIFVNKRNVEKNRFWYKKTWKKFKWVSKYGSITINQLGRELPTCGMNEAGLVISTMMLTTARFPSADRRPAFIIPQWIQYQLDNCATIDEVIATNLKIRPSKRELPVHFFITDSTGNSVTMEWLNGKLVYHKGNKLPVSALTNETYGECINFYLKDKRATPQSNWSKWRFNHIADKIKKYSNLPEKPPIEYSFTILESVSSTWVTMWSLVFDITNMRVYFKTKENREIRFVDFSAFDFSSASPVMFLDINSKLSGDVKNYFRKYTHEENENLIINSNKGNTEKTFPDKFLKRAAEYPETTRNLDQSL